MTILLTILKWLGIILLILLVLVLIVLLIVLLVPFRYKVRARVDDPQSHEEFPVSALKENSDVFAQISWLLGALKVMVSYPTGELLCVKIFGKDIGIMKLLKKEDSGKQEEQQKEKDESTPDEKREALIGKAEKAIRAGDYVCRVLTGRCGRRATDKIMKRVSAIIRHVLPESWQLGGTIGLSDPCMNGNLAQVSAVLRPFMDGHLNIKTQWEMYRCDLKADAAGQLRLIVPVKEAVPLIFDKDIKKVIRKLMKVKAKLQ